MELKEVSLTVLFIAALLMPCVHVKPVNGAPISFTADESSAISGAPSENPNNAVMSAINIGGQTVGGYVAEAGDLFKAEDVPMLRKFSVSGDKAEQISPLELRDVLRSQISSKAREGLSLRIPVDAGVYTVHLVFAELWEGAFSPGARVFDVRIGTYMCGEQLVARDFDVYSAAGHRGYTGVVQTIENVATRGGINIRLKPKKQSPILNAVVIEGVKMDAAEINMVGCSGHGAPPSQGAMATKDAAMRNVREQPLKHVVGINVGSDAAVGGFESDADRWWLSPPDANGKMLRRRFSVAEDKLTSGAGQHEHASAAALRTQITSSGGASLVLRIPVARPGVYKVHMLFAELWDGAFTPGKRVFDIRVNTDACGEKLVKAGMDVYSEAGQRGYTGVLESVQDVTANDYIDLKLVPKKQNAVLNAIWVEGVELTGDQVKGLACSLTPRMAEHSSVDEIIMRMHTPASQAEQQAAEPGALEMAPAEKYRPAVGSSERTEAPRILALQRESGYTGQIPQGPIFNDVAVV